MELTESERMLLELMQVEDARAQAESRARQVRFSRIVSERLGIPVEHLRIDAMSGAVSAIEDQPNEP